MPVEVESTSQFEDLTNILKKRTWWILVPLALIGTLGTSFAVLVPKKYVAKTRIMVNEVRNRTGQIVTGSEGQGRAAKHLVRSPNRIRAVIQALGWPYASLSRIEQEDLVEKILDNLEVEVPPMGPGIAEQIVVIKYADTDPNRAHDFAEEVSRRWREETLEANRKAKTRAYSDLDDRNRAKESRIEEIGTEIASLMEQHGIPPWKPDYYNTERPLAPEFNLLEQAKAEFNTLEGESEKLAASIARDETRYERMGDVVPYVEATEGLNLDKQIRERREVIIELQNEIAEKGYKPTHSLYRAYASRIQVIESEINMLEDARIESSVTESWRENVKKIELGQKIDQRREDLEATIAKLDSLTVEIDNLQSTTAELQSVYQLLARLENERERVNESLMTDAANLQDMRIELDLANSKSGDPFDILDPVNLPSRATEPNPVLISVFSILLGLALGLGLALMTEYSKPCFRGVTDVTRVMIVPVLGTVESIVTTSQRRKRRFVANVMGLGVFGFVFLVSYVTWAYVNSPELLSDSVVQQIQEFQQGFE